MFLSCLELLTVCCLLRKLEIAAHVFIYFYTYFFFSEAFDILMQIHEFVVNVAAFTGVLPRHKSESVQTLDTKEDQETSQLHSVGVDSNVFIRN